VRSFQPHLMLLDIMLPDMEGFEVARRLGAERAGLPIVFLTGGGFGSQDGRVGASELMAAVQKVGTKAFPTTGGTLYDPSGRAGALLAR